jgi:hypothetical protein
MSHMFQRALMVKEKIRKATKDAKKISNQALGHLNSLEQFQ